MNNTTFDEENASPDQPAKPNAFGGMLVAGGSLGGIGCSMPVLVIAAIFGGRWLDARLGTEPLFLLGLLLSSIVAGVAFMISSAYTAARAAQVQLAKNTPASAYDGKAHSLSDQVPHDSYGEDNR